MPYNIVCYSVGVDLFLDVFVCLSFGNIRQRVGFRFVGFCHLARHPALPSTPMHASQEMSMNECGSTNNYDTKAELWPRSFRNLLISIKSGMLILLRRTSYSGIRRPS